MKTKHNIKTIISIILLSGIIILGLFLISYKNYLLSKAYCYTLGITNGESSCGKNSCLYLCTFYVGIDSFQASAPKISSLKGKKYIIVYSPIDPEFASEVLIDLPISADDTTFKFGDTIPRKLIESMRLK